VDEEVGWEDEVEDAVGEEAEVNGAEGGDGQDEVDTQRDADNVIEGAPPCVVCARVGILASVTFSRCGRLP
jgi:hypothetical protein